MEQGQPEPGLPGDGRGVTQRFLTDVVVCEDYVIQEGRIIPQGTIRARYHPGRCPELPQQLARVSRGDTAAALAFVRTGSVSKVEMATPMGLIYKALFSSISTFETPPNGETLIAVDDQGSILRRGCQRTHER